MTDETGQVVNAYEYDSYGRPLFIQEAVAQPFAYTGREYDSATGLYHYRARSYDASTGRFMQEDPIGYGGRDFNFFRYVGSNPVNYNDPSGLAGEYAMSGAELGKVASEAGILGCTISVTISGVAAYVATIDDPNKQILARPCLLIAVNSSNDIYDDDPLPVVLDKLTASTPPPPDRCKRVEQQCRIACQGFLGRSRTNQGNPFFRCLNQCLYDENCGGNNYR